MPVSQIDGSHISRSLRSNSRILVGRNSYLKYLSFGTRPFALTTTGLLSLSCLLLASACGCGGPENKHGRLPISGTVTLDGEPLMGGYLIFEPKSGQPTQSGGMISNGRFDVPEKAGAAPGLYSVAIFSGAAAPTGTLQPGTPEYEAASKKAPGERVPRKFNVDSILTREVKAGEVNEFTFEITTK